MSDDTKPVHTNYPAAGEEYEFDGIPHVMVPDNCQLVSMERSLGKPMRIRARVALRELGSFLQYVGEFKAEESQIFALATHEGLTATAIFDYPENAMEPAWGDHRCTLTSVFSPEWLKWRGLDNQLQTQTKFAEFVEDQIKLFTSPVGSDMLTIARDIEMKQNVEWKGSVRMENGDTSVSFISQSKAGAGAVELPPFFRVALQPFLGGSRYEFTARLRVKLDEGSLTLRYELLQVDATIEAAVKDIVAEIKAKTGLSPLSGIAPEKVG